MEMGSVCASVRASVRMLWTRYLENGMTDFDQTSLVDLYGQCLGWVRSHANSAHTNELCWHLIGRYCDPSIRMLWTRYLENGMTDFDQTSPVDLYGQCLGWVWSRANFAHTNELCCHLIGRYCLCTISNHFHSRLSQVHLAGAYGLVFNKFRPVNLLSRFSGRSYFKIREMTFESGRW
jgi:hypothetical protein